MLFSEKSQANEIENDFIRLAAEGDPDPMFGGGEVPDTAGGEIEGEGNPLDEKLDPSLPDEEEDSLPEQDADMIEKQAVKDLIPWDTFVILFDPHYAKTLQDSLQLPEPKAKSKSFYIYYAPENKRIEGIINKRYVGGYGQKEVLGEDFEFMKKQSPEGFPPDWKEKAMSDIDELPAIENSRVKEELRKESGDVEDEEEVVDKEEEKVDELESDEESAPRLKKQKKPTQEQPAPAPVGNVNTSDLPAAASIKELHFRRFARLQKLKNI